MGVVSCCSSPRKNVVNFNDYVVEILSATNFSNFTFKQLYLMLFRTEFDPTKYSKEEKRNIITQEEFMVISQNFYSKDSDYATIHKEMFSHMSELLAFDGIMSCEKLLLIFLSLLKDTFSEKIVFFSHIITPYVKESIGESNYYINNRIKFFVKAYLDANLIFFNKLIFATLHSTFREDKEFLKYFITWFFRCKIDKMRNFMKIICPHFDPNSNFMTTSIKYYLDVFTENPYMFNFYELRKEYLSRNNEVDANLALSSFNYNELDDKDYSNSLLMKSINNQNLRIENPELNLDNQKEKNKEERLNGNIQ